MAVRTTCRLCESACGLVATVEDGAVTALAPDPDHPVSRGLACRKGTTFHRWLADADRLVRPRVDGRDTDWPSALGAAGGRIRDLLDRHGPDAVGLYSGNAAGHSLGTVLGLAALQRGLGLTKHHSCLTLDNSPQYAVAQWVFGHPLCTFVADYAGSDAIVLFGTDPLASQPSQAQSHPRGPADLRANREALVVVDPRRSDTARAASTHLAPRVGTDVFLLAWLVRQALERTGTHPGLREAVEPFGVERVAGICGVSSTDLRALDGRIAQAGRPLVWSGLGVLLGPHGTLGWWLTVCLQALTGGIGPGRPWFPGGSGALRRLMGALDLKGHDPTCRSRIGGWPAQLDTFPAATLADDVLTEGPDRLRALVVVGGEPLRALPDTARARRALEALDLLVVVGLSAGGTARLAHVALPAASWLERDESALHMGVQRPAPFVRLDRAVVRPAGLARPDWTILTELTRAAGERIFGSRALDALQRASGAGPDALMARLPVGRPASTSPSPTLEVPHLLEAVRRLEDPSPGLRLLTSVRPVGAMNHWIRPTSEPDAQAHPDDLARAGVSAGDAWIDGPAGSLRVVLAPDASVAPGTLVVPYGAHDANALVSTSDLEAFCGQPVSNGTIVTLRPVADPG